MRAATAALPQGPSFRAGLCCPSPSTLTRPHPPHSRAHRDFAAQRFMRDAFAVPWPRRPASGSVLSLRVLCRHATLYRPRGVRRLHTPSSLTGDAGLHTTLIVRHSRLPHESASRGPVISGLPRFASCCGLSTCLPPLADPTGIRSQPTETFTPGLPTSWSPFSSPSMTTMAAGQLPSAGLPPARTAASIAALGSGTGAAIRRQLLGRIRGFPLRARIEAAVIPFPVPAASHAACGFAALRAPASLRVKGYGAVPDGPMAWRRWSTHLGPIAEQLLQFPRYPRLSPDGRRLALTIGPLNAGNIWIYDLAGGAQSLKLTFHDHNLFPIWSSDGQRILFISRAGSDRLLSVPANGTAVEPEPLLTTEEPHVPLDWSPDGQTVLLSRTSAQTRSDLMLLSMSDRITHPWLVTPFAEGEARFSPDGRWVAYTSDQTGRSEIWVRPFPGPGAPVRVSADGGQDPVWSHGGKELFFRSSMKILSAPNSVDCARTASGYTSGAVRRGI
jgi:hypothetical protein